MILSADDPGVAVALLDARFKRRLLAEGDSWFSLGGWTGNLLMALDDAHTLIVNCAGPGDEMSRMGGDVFAELLAPTDGMPEWDAILLSGGGNDLLGRCAEFVVPDPAAPIDDAALTRVLDAIERHLRRFMRIVQAGQPGVPVVCHTYDLPPVSRRWWWWHLGPWVAPVFNAAGIARESWNGLAAMLINDLCDRIRRVAEDAPALHVVDTLGLLNPRRHWRNEIHPNARGYAVLAQPWRAALRAIH